MTARALKIIGVNVLVFLGLLLMIEAILQLIALAYPSYDVLYLQPDRVLGWKEVPNLHWTWAGHNWYASDFSVEVHTNALGFRDLARPVGKPPGVRRVALLGDSFIEAVQVPLQRTAGQLLERALNAPAAQRVDRPVKWQVLNFGISNFGVGQYLLTWDRYAADYRPDYVAIFVAKFHMARTIKQFEDGAFLANASTRLWVRPTFRVEDDRLIGEPARDFDRFVKAQEHLIATEFSGGRSRRKQGVLTAHYAGELKDGLRDFMLASYRRIRHIPAQASVDSAADARLLDVNLRIIAELGRKVTNAGGTLIVLDASRYFGDSATISAALQGLCRQHDLGYIPLYDYLMRANADGIRTRWAGDGHFNEAGNELLAEAVFQWMTEHMRETESQ